MVDLAMDEQPNAICAHCGDDMNQKAASNWKLYCNKPECADVLRQELMKQTAPKRKRTNEDGDAMEKEASRLARLIEDDPTPTPPPINGETVPVSDTSTAPTSLGIHATVEIASWFTTLTEEFTAAGTRAAQSGVRADYVYRAVKAGLNEVLGDSLRVNMTSRPG